MSPDPKTITEAVIGRYCDWKMLNSLVKKYAHILHRNDVNHLKQRARQLKVPKPWRSWRQLEAALKTQTD